MILDRKQRTANQLTIEDKMPEQDKKLMNIEEAIRIINLNPEIDAKLFWTEIGVSMEAIKALAVTGAMGLNTSPSLVVSCMEIGAALARPDIVERLG